MFYLETLATEVKRLPPMFLNLAWVGRSQLAPHRARICASCEDLPRGGERRATCVRR